MSCDVLTAASRTCKEIGQPEGGKKDTAENQADLDEIWEQKFA